MKDEIRISGIRGFGFHGVYEDERFNGQDFFVDVTLQLDLTKASQMDDFSETVDYGDVCNFVMSEITGAPIDLIEKLAGRIANGLMAQHPKVNSLQVTVHKPGAPVKAEVIDISVTVVRTR